jgi:hypothetical protein
MVCTCCGGEGGRERWLSWEKHRPAQVFEVGKLRLQEPRTFGAQVYGKVPSK